MSKCIICDNISNLLNFVNNAIERNELTGTSSPPPVAVNRLRIFETLLDNVALNIMNNQLDAASFFLADAIQKSNGNDKDGKDFVTGSARPCVETLMTQLKTKVDREISNDQVYGSLKASGQI